MKIDPDGNPDISFVVVADEEGAKERALVSRLLSDFEKTGRKLCWWLDVCLTSEEILAMEKEMKARKKPAESESKSDPGSESESDYDLGSELDTASSSDSFSSEPEAPRKTAANGKSNGKAKINKEEKKTAKKLFKEAKRAAKINTEEKKAPKRSKMEELLVSKLISRYNGHTVFFSAQPVCANQREYRCSTNRYSTYQLYSLGFPNMEPSITLTE